jgi:cytochrome c-type biogenesis protein CcmE
VIPGDKEKDMLKKRLTVLFALVLTIPLVAAVFAQQAPAPAKKVRWEGIVIRSSMEKSTLTVREVSSDLEKTVMYDDSTKWVSQFHGDKKVNDIGRSDVKDDDYVICSGTWDKAGVLHATLISKRLSHSPAP